MGFKQQFIDFWKPGWKHPDPKMRVRTVSRMTSKVVLMDVYEHDEDASVRVAVAKRLKDQALLTGIAENDQDYSVRKAAYLRMTKNNLDKLTNQAFIADVAKNDKDSDIRKVAVGKLTDQAVLTDLARNDEAESVRFAAVSKLTGQSLVYVAPGSFQMGSDDGDSDEQPVHLVTISRGYGLGKYSVTQKEYESVMGTNPSDFKGSNRPVEQVSWHDAVEYCETLTARERAAGRLPSGSGYEYRLPTEAEWEFAAREGTKSRGYKYSGSDNIDRVGRGGSWSTYAWYCRSANRINVSPGNTFNGLGFRVAFARSSL
jgi:formylglycine-generating enzyme required for sulfatase activity